MTTMLDASKIVAGCNDRTVFDRAGLEELAASIQKHGLAQPVVVRPRGEVYEIVAGERRYRAMTTILGWAEIPALVHEYSDEDASAIMLAENVGRKDLDPVDEALAYRKRQEQFGWSDAEIAKRSGASPERIKKRLKLLAVRDDILALVRSGQFPVGHAEMLAQLDKNRQMIASKPLIAGQPINARQFRELVDKLYAEQCQESLFDLSLLSVSQVSQSVKVSPVTFPVADDTPPVPADGSHTGAAIYDYIGVLRSKGFDREASVVGALLLGLSQKNYVRLPVEATTA